MASNGKGTKVKKPKVLRWRSPNKANFAFLDMQGHLHIAIDSYGLKPMHLRLRLRRW